MSCHQALQPPPKPLCNFTHCPSKTEVAGLQPVAGLVFSLGLWPSAFRVCMSSMDVALLWTHQLGDLWVSRPTLR